ncbi:MAG: hypothetical protein K1X94_24460 [Sandaracinaceae bacterium]|nr:hypothetical protein [Sandaracinaceae bacterium]
MRARVAAVLACHSVAVACLASLTGCVTDTTVIGDDRTRFACAEAPILDLPPFGCTTITLTSTGPWGCSIVDDRGNWLGELSGSWVRLRASDRPGTLRVRVLTPPPSCSTDAGASDAGSRECFAQFHLRRGGTPCACLAGALETVALDAMSTWEGPLVGVEQEILIEPVGTDVEVSLCAP